jgi:hypothetical protein
MSIAHPHEEFNSIAGEQGEQTAEVDWLMREWLAAVHRTGRRWWFCNPAGEQAESVQRLRRRGVVELAMDDDTGALAVRLVRKEVRR